MNKITPLSIFLCMCMALALQDCAYGQDAIRDEVVRIDCEVNINTLIEVFEVVREADNSPILSVQQDKRESKTITLTDPNGHDRHPEENDPDTLVVRTGVVKGPLDGGGKIHHLKKSGGKWQVVSTGYWAS